MNHITDEATRRAKDGITRPGWPLFVNERRAKAIEAGTAETVKQGSAHRAKARSATPICPKTTAITSKDAAA